LGFRQRLAGEFSAELGTRIYENAAPPDTALPYATYRRVSPGDETYGVKTARIQVIVVDDSYADAKRLQGRIEKAMRGLRARWISDAGADCPAWVYRIKTSTMPDVYQSTTRRRLAISDFEILYADR
jgi:hypothetical protein